METEEPIYWYRFEEVSYSVADEYGDHAYSTMKLHLRKMKVLRKTSCGVQLIGLSYGTGNPRFVNREWRKRFACPTIEDAAKSFVARKRKQISIYEARIGAAEQAIKLLEYGHITEGRDW